VVVRSVRKRRSLNRHGLRCAAKHKGLNDFWHYGRRSFCGHLTIAAEVPIPYSDKPSSAKTGLDPMSLNVELARHNMVEQQVRPWDVLDSRVLEALSALRREDFVPDACKNLAFADLELPMAFGEIMMKPVLEGRMLQAAAPLKSESVLEIGTGSGFFSACLARLSLEVVSVEQHVDFVDAARVRLAGAGVRNARVEHAEAVNGFVCDRSFDVMIVTGAVAVLPARWRKWIKPGGRLLAIVGESPAQRAVLYSCDAHGQWSEQALFETDLPYLNHASPTARFAL
jgi:protein-L-isoaspartate(D-aspartate) O-methyltransferase